MHRTNSARLWLSFFAPLTPQVQADRRKYAKLVGNIGDDDYAIFESAITGRASVELGEAPPDDPNDSQGSFLNRGAQTAEEAHRIRTAVVEQDGLLEQIFGMLRNAPRRVLMILKLNVRGSCLPEEALLIVEYRI
jgi:aarF domain-containing kinase